MARNYVGGSDKSLEDLTRMFNPVVQGWINYFASFYHWRNSV